MIVASVQLASESGPAGRPTTGSEQRRDVILHPDMPLLDASTCSKTLTNSPDLLSIIATRLLSWKEATTARCFCSRPSLSSVHGPARKPDAVTAGPVEAHDTSLHPSLRALCIPPPRPSDHCQRLVMPPPEVPPQPVSPRASTTPLISSAEREAAAVAHDPRIDSGTEEKDSKSGKRRFFGLGGKKKDDNQATPAMASSTTSASTTAAAAPASQAAPAAVPRVDLKPQAQPIPVPVSPSRAAQPANLAASPARLRSASPRRHSPASSEIFERNVQEPAQIAQLQGELSPAHIPSHVITEDHIPPTLEVAAQAITSDKLNPDEVEIVTSTAHQPAASVLESSTSHADLTQLNSPLSPLQHIRSEDSEHASSMHHSGLLPSSTEEDGASNYGSLDPTDVRRLSFISFADVVQSEHQAPLSAVSEVGSPFAAPRSPPLHSPTTGITTPPLPGVNVVPSGVEQSPPASSVHLPGSHSELTIETMRQAVRKTASGDLSVVKNAGRMSPVSDEPFASAPRSRTNS